MTFHFNTNLELDAADNSTYYLSFFERIHLQMLTNRMLLDGIFLTSFFFLQSMPAQMTVKVLSASQMYVLEYFLLPGLLLYYFFMTSLYLP